MSTSDLDESEAKSAHVESKFVSNEVRSLNEIIAHLTRKCGGNVH